MPEDTAGITCALVKPQNQQKRSSDDINISVNGKCSLRKEKFKNWPLVKSPQISSYIADI